MKYTEFDLGKEVMKQRAGATKIVIETKTEKDDNK